ncbi:MAG: hypothetical protein LUE87_07425, partial [Lachnospiraceae bacterium]|nr:hypothetical protein [Lachnospiraceae bacterium]
FWRKYVNLIVLIAIISLFFWLAGSIMGVIRPSGTITYEWDETRRAVNYYNFYYAPTGQLADTLIYGIQRNCGIFTEGTMFAFQLVIAFMMEMRSSNGRPFVKIILVATLYTTFSTTGIIATVLYYGIRLFFSESNSKFSKICKALFLPFIVVIGSIALLNLALTKMTTGSYGVRYDHIVTCFKTFIDTFPIGLGYGGSEVLQSYYHYKQGSSVGIPLLFAYGGLGGALLIILPTFLYVYYSVKEKKWEGLAYTVTFTLICFFTSVMTGYALPWAVTAFVYMKGSYEMKKSEPD